VRSTRGGGAEDVFTVGFCFGGRNSFNQAAEGHGLAGVIGFYGRVAPGDAGDPNAPTIRAATYACPVLGLFGGADQSITAADVESFATALEAAGVRNDLVTYPGAPHSFFDRTFDQHRDACDDAWRRVLAFIEANPTGENRQR
jgi:carboxymethylenebutenolidase